MNRCAYYSFGMRAYFQVISAHTFELNPAIGLIRSHRIDWLWNPDPLTIPYTLMLDLKTFLT